MAASSLVSEAYWKYSSIVKVAARGAVADVARNRLSLHLFTVENVGGNEGGSWREGEKMCKR